MKIPRRLNDTKTEIKLIKSEEQKMEEIVFSEAKLARINYNFYQKIF